MTGDHSAMIQLLAILRVQPARKVTRFLLSCGLLGTALGTTAARAGERRVGAAQSSQESRLPRESLLVSHGPDGARKPVATTDDWLRRRNEIVAGMQAVMGRLPGPEKHCPLDMKIEEEVDCGSYVRRSITYRSEPGSRVP